MTSSWSILLPGQPSPKSHIPMSFSFRPSSLPYLVFGLCVPHPTPPVLRPPVVYCL